MKKIIFIVFLLCLSFTTSRAFSTEITSGQIFIGGDSYKTPHHQNYLAFNFVGKRQNPRIEYRFFGQQDFSVFQNHPVRPEGMYNFSVKMPYSPDAIRINDELKSPVWYSDCVWDIQSSIDTPIVTAKSPKFMNVRAPFGMRGRMIIYGAASIATRVRGFGTADLKFEQIGGKYYLLEARYLFGKDSVETKNSK